jgi:hypothetical protein
MQTIETAKRPTPATKWVNGHEFHVTNVILSNGHRYFTGVCTDAPCNDGIRHTGYNGGVYLLD